MERKQITNDEVAFHSLSFCDYNGRLFKWQGKLYRAIPAEQTSLYQDILQKGIVRELVAKKLLIETELTSLTVENYAIVIKHRQLDFVSYPREWCNEMLKDAALLHLDLCLELDRHDLTTADAHPLNILFDGCQPIFVDFGSIDRISRDSSYWLWPPYEQFCCCFLNPLRLMARGQGRIARWLLHDYEKGVTSSDLEALNPNSQSLLSRTKDALDWLKSNVRRRTPTVIIPWAKQIRDRTRSILLTSTDKSPSRRTFLEQIREEVVSIDLASLPEKSADSQVDWLTFDSTNGDRQTKLQVFSSILSNLQPNSVLEIGNNDNEGSYAQLAAEKGVRAVFFTPEERKAKQLYLRGKENQLPILPLLMNFASPSCDLSNVWFAPAGDRLSCDLVLALDLIDWLVFKKYLPFDTIVERLSIFTKSWLLIEFTIRQPPYRASWSSEVASRFSWYQLDNFANMLGQKFSKVETLNRCSNSILLLCTK